MSPLPDRRPARLLRGLLDGLAAAGLFLGGASPRMTRRAGVAAAWEEVGRELWLAAPSHVRET